MVIAVIAAGMAARNNSSILPLGHPVLQFDVSFPEKPLKIVATRGKIFSLKFTKYGLVARLRLGPLGEVKCSPDSPRPLAAIKGAYF